MGKGERCGDARNRKSQASQCATENFDTRHIAYGGRRYSFDLLENKLGNGFLFRSGLDVFGKRDYFVVQSLRRSGMWCPGQVLYQPACGLDP